MQADTTESAVRRRVIRVDSLHLEAARRLRVFGREHVVFAVT